MIHTTLFHTLLAAVLFQGDPSSLAQAIARFDASGLTDREALFDAFRVGGNDSTLIANLHRWHETAAAEDVRLEVDTLLDQLGEPHACLPRWPADRAVFTLQFAGPESFDPADLDAIERGDPTASTRALVDALYGRDHAQAAARAAIRAAFAAWRPSNAARLGPSAAAARLPEPHATSLSFLRDFAPSVLAAAVDAEMRSAPDDAFLDFALDALALPIVLETVGAEPPQRLVDAGKRMGPAGEAARRALFAAVGAAVSLPTARRTASPDHDDLGFERPWWSLYADRVQALAGDPRIDAMLADVFGDAVLQAVSATPQNLAAMRSALVVARFSPTLRKRLIEMLQPRLDDPSALGDEAAFFLAHLDVDSAPLRERYVRIVDALPTIDRDTWQGIPCLVRHDEVTRAALARLATRSSAPFELTREVVRAGLLSDLSGTFAREWFGRFTADQHAVVWRDLQAFGLRTRAPIDAEHDDAERTIVKVAISWNDASDDVRAELTARFEAAVAAIDDYAGNPAHPQCLWPTLAAALGLRTPRLIDRALELAIDFDSSTYAQIAMCDYLATCSLDAEQQWRLCALRTMFGEFEPSILDVFARQGPGAMPRVAHLRSALRSWATNGDVPRGSALQTAVPMIWLETLFAIARPSADDLPVLEQALRYGSADDRARAARIIELRRIDGPAIRAGLAHAEGDLEPRVREAARQALRTLGN